MRPGITVAPAPSITRASRRGRPPPRWTAAMRWPSTSTSAGNGAAPLPSRIIVLTISVRSMASSARPTIARWKPARSLRAEGRDGPPRALPKPASSMRSIVWHEVSTERERTEPNPVEVMRSPSEIEHEPQLFKNSSWPSKEGRAMVKDFRVLLILCLTVASWTLPAAANEVVQWNETTMKAIEANGQASVVATRTLAMVQVAVHDALNAISHRYDAYYFEGPEDPPA